MANVNFAFQFAHATNFSQIFSKQIYIIALSEAINVCIYYTAYYFSLEYV